MTGPVAMSDSEDGFRFEFTVRVRDISAHDTGFRATVRAWNLKDACAKAAALNLIDWELE